MSNQGKNIAIFGCNGAIGAALTREMATAHPDATIRGYSRSGAKPELDGVTFRTIDYLSDSALSQAAGEAARFDRVIVATGLLHEGGITPEKSLKEMTGEKLRRLFEVNAVIPALIARHFLPRLNRERPSVFAALSARVGSISDNRLGGWYSYRASKSALNMIIRTAAVEVARNNRSATVVGLHPGTVDSFLSKPFQRNVPEGGLFTPEVAAKHLLKVIEGLDPCQSGKCIAWDGSEITP